MQPRRHEDTKKAIPQALVCFAMFVCAVAAPQGQQGLPQGRQPDPPLFRTGSLLIVETVTVKDRDGKPIEGLTAGDFTVTEDGEPQVISFVEYQRLPGPGDVAAADRAPAPSVPPPPAARAGVAPPTQAALAVPPPGDNRYRDRRLLVLYFDPSAMPPADQMRAYTNALRFVDTQMSPADLVAIVTLQRGAVRVRQDFTDNRMLLREVMQTLIFGDDQDGDGIPDPLPGTAFGQDEGEFNIFNTDRQLAALQTAVTMLRPIPGQKSLIFFASGLRLNGTDNQAQMRATVNAAIRANVAIHTIDARGLVAAAPLGDATTPSPGGVGMFNGRFADAAVNAQQRSQDSMYALAKDTGGRPMFDYNDLSLGIVQVAESMVSYYSIGYYSTHTAQDGRFRRVRVSLTGGREGELSYRQGYFADKAFSRFTAADKERQLEDALMLENPITDIAIAMEVNYFQLNRAQYLVPVAVKIPGSELALARRGGAQRTVIDFIGEVKDEYGYTMQNVRDKLDIELSAETAAQLATRPIQYETGFTLLPGKYVIKLLARDAETGRMGTYQAAFTIPNLLREESRIPISSVVLGSQRVPLGDALYTVRQKLDTDAVNPLVSGGQKLIPSVTRVFSRSRDLHVFLQAYERGATTTQPLVAFVSFYQGQAKVYDTPPLAVTSGLDPRTRAVPLSFAVALAPLRPGQYDCQVTVLDPTGQKAAFWQAPIVVIP
jgi:VWFA-related protein